MKDIELQDKKNDDPEDGVITFSNKRKLPLKERIKEILTDPKKRVIAIGIFGLVIIGLVGAGLYLLTNEGRAPVAQQEGKKSNKSDGPTTPAILTGALTAADAANRHPLAVIIENHPDSRPQAGLDKADIVYEAIAEGGITRFMALFGSQEAEKVGPIRSARTFFVDWARGYEAYLAHVGGNIDALDQIKAEKVLDLDQFAYSGPYWRERNGIVATEHTMFTDTTKLREQATKNKYSTANNFAVYKFKDDQDAGTLPASQKITVNFSNDTYKVIYEYDKTTNSYKRLMAGTPHVDQVTKHQINPKNIVVMTVNRKPTVTRINEPGYDMTTVGSGKAKIFIDGKAVNGTWKKTAKTDREIFYDESGAEIVFGRGQTWIEVIPPEASVTVE